MSSIPARYSGVHAVRPRAAVAGLLLLIGLPLAVPAQAQSQKTDFSIYTSLTATDNGGGAAEGLERADLLFTVRPHVQYFREGTGLRVQASAGADMVASARSTRRDRILPTALLAVQGTLVDRVLFIDSSVDVRQVEIDPFGARPAAGSSNNSRTAGTYRVSPYATMEFSPRTSLLGRFDGARTRHAGTSEGDVDTRRAFVKLETKPEPLGASLEWLTEDTQYADLVSTDLRVDRLQGALNLALSAEWIVGAALGSERSEFASTTQTDRVVGLRAFWAPGPRTQLAGALDRRFFGNGWSISARHRTPQMSFLFRTLREPSSATNSQSNQGMAGGLASFLDSILTTRNPDDAQRGALVNDLVATRGLQTSLLGASARSGSYPQLRTGNEMTWVWLGTRTMFSLALYAQELRQLARSDGSAVAPGAATADNRQRGVSFGWNRRLSPQTSVDASASWSRIEGLASRAGDRSREGLVRANVVRNLSPRTNLSVGLTLRRVESTVTTVNSFDENSAFVGLGHRF